MHACDKAISICMTRSTTPVSAECQCLYNITRSVTFDWENADITLPMEHAQSGSIVGMWYIYTTVSNQGSAVEEFEVPCADVWYMWARAWTPNDTYKTLKFHVDAQGSRTWTLANTSGTWIWQQARNTDNTTWSGYLLEGGHSLTAQGGAGGATMDYRPAMGDVVFTNDTDYTP